MFFILLAGLLAAFQTVHAQNDKPLALVMTADGPVMPPMLEYIKRGIQTAERRNAEVLIIQLNTPGGDLLTTLDIIGAIRASRVPVVVYVAPRNAIAGSAGALITMAGHISAMAPETVIGASTPISGSGENLTSDERAKATNASKAAIRDIVSPRGPDALKLAESMIDEAKAATASEALQVHLVDFVVDNIDDLLESLDGFTVKVNNESRTLHTASATTEQLNMTFIEQFLLLLTNPNIVANRDRTRRRFSVFRNSFRKTMLDAFASFAPVSRMCVRVVNTNAIRDHVVRTDIDLFFATNLAAVCDSSVFPDRQPAAKARH